MGDCSFACPVPTIECEGGCIDPRFDPANCGSCGNMCADDSVCRQGSCADTAQCDWSSVSFPLEFDSDMVAGDIAVDDSCNLYVAYQRTDSSAAIYKQNYATGELSSILEVTGGLRGVVYRPQDHLLYASAVDRLIALNPDGSGLRELPESATQPYLNGMTLAPANWGKFGGDLIVSNSLGDILAFDPEEPALVQVTSLAGEDLGSMPALSDVEFDGQQLYVAVYDARKIVRVTPGGVASDFVTLPCMPDGLAVETGQRLFASCDTVNAIYSVAVPNGSASQIGMAALSQGWAPSGLLWDGDALMVLEGTTSGAFVDALFF